jgi:hypothetical protein
MQALRSILTQYYNHGKPFQQLHAVWGLLKTISQIFASIVNNLISTIFPLRTSRYIVYFFFAGYVSWRAILTIVSGKFSLAEPFNYLGYPENYSW